MPSSNSSPTPSPNAQREMDIAGPSTPITRQTTSHLDEDYFNGVPGAPARKLRSQPEFLSHEIQEDRKKKAKGVARLLDFGAEKNRKGNSRCVNGADKAGRGNDDEDDFLGSSMEATRKGKSSQLNSPISIKSEDRSIQTADVVPPLKRSYSTSACTKDLFESIVTRKPRRVQDQNSEHHHSDATHQTRLSPSLRLHQISMRRAESVLSDHSSMRIDTSGSAKSFWSREEQPFLSPIVGCVTI